MVQRPRTAERTPRGSSNGSGICWLGADNYGGAAAHTDIQRPRCRLATGSDAQEITTATGSIDHDLVAILSWRFRVVLGPRLSLLL